MRVCVSKEFLRRQIEEREAQKRAEKDRRVCEDLELERQMLQQQLQQHHRSVPNATLQHPRSEPARLSSELPHNTSSAVSVNYASARPQAAATSHDAVSIIRRKKGCNY